VKLVQRAVAFGATAISVVVLVPPAVASASLKVQPSTLPSGPVAQPYSQTLSASGGLGPYTFAVVAGKLPSGIKLYRDGTLSGTPPANEKSSFTVQATDSSSPAITGTRRYTLTFGVLFVTGSLPSANIGSSYSKQIVAAGGTAPYSFSVTSGSLPSGLTLSPSGLLSGSPTAGPGTWTFTVTVADSGSPQQTNSRTYKLRVTPVGQWTLCTYSSAGTAVDNVTLAANNTMSDANGNTGTWTTDSNGYLQMAFDEDYYGTWDEANQQFDGAFMNMNGSWAMVAGADNGASCVRPA
jgi:hypothetical protein